MVSPIGLEEKQVIREISGPILGIESAIISPQNEIIFEEDLEEIKKQGRSTFALPIIGYAHRIK